MEFKEFDENNYWMYPKVEELPNGGKPLISEFEVNGVGDIDFIITRNKYGGYLVDIFVDCFNGGYRNFRSNNLSIFKLEEDGVLKGCKELADKISDTDNIDSLSNLLESYGGFSIVIRDY